jgi:YfiH family protein
MITNGKVLSKEENIDIQFWGSNVPGSHGKFLTDRANQEIIDESLLALKKASHYDKISLMNQKHTNVVKHVSRDNYTDSDFICDGQVSNEKGIALAVQTADCVPILFLDSKQAIIGAAHAGWRGAIGGVIENTIAKMKKLGAEKIKAIIGPCIRQDSYEVDPDFKEQFCENDPANDKYFKISNEKPNKFLFDLPSYVRGKLVNMGIVEVFDCDVNTYTDSNLYSFRRYTHFGGAYGSNISLICLK